MLIFSWLWHLSFWESYNPGRIQLNLLSSQVISFITVSSEWWWWYFVTAIWEYFQSTRSLIKQMLGFTWPVTGSTSSFQKKPKISSWNFSQWSVLFEVFISEICVYTVYIHSSTYTYQHYLTTGINHTRVIFWAAHLLLIHFLNAFLF